MLNRRSLLASVASLGLSSAAGCLDFAIGPTTKLGWLGIDNWDPGAAHRFDLLARGDGSPDCVTAVVAYGTHRGVDHDDPLFVHGDRPRSVSQQCSASAAADTALANQCHSDTHPARRGTT